MLAIMICGLLVGIVYFLQIQSKSTTALQSFDAASEEFAKIQQKYINLISYNWLKVLSLKQPQISITSSKNMFNESISSLSMTSI